MIVCGREVYAMVALSTPLVQNESTLRLSPSGLLISSTHSYNRSR